MSSKSGTRGHNVGVKTWGREGHRGAVYKEMES